MQRLTGWKLWNCKTSSLTARRIILKLLHLVVSSRTIMRLFMPDSVPTTSRRFRLRVSWTDAWSIASVTGSVSRQSMLIWLSLLGLIIVWRSRSSTQMFLRNSIMAVGCLFTRTVDSPEIVPIVCFTETSMDVLALNLIL